MYLCLSMEIHYCCVDNYMYTHYFCSSIPKQPSKKTQKTRIFEISFLRKAPLRETLSVALTISLFVQQTTNSTNWPRFYHFSKFNSKSSFSVKKDFSETWTGTVKIFLRAVYPICDYTIQSFRHFTQLKSSFWWFFGKNRVDKLKFSLMLM